MIAKNADEKDSGCETALPASCKYDKISCYCKNWLNFLRDAHGIFLGAEKFMGEYPKDPAH